MLFQGQMQAMKPTAEITGSYSKCLLHRFPPFSPVSCRKFSGPCLAFFADYGLQLKDSQSPRQVILVQRGFWSGTLSSFFSAELCSSIVKMEYLPSIALDSQKLKSSKKTSAENSKGVQILALYSVVYSHLLREF